jgi:tetratricopeptide (TPR) repeat protein
VLPDPRTIAAPDEREAVSDLMALLVGTPPSDAAALARFDAALAKLTRPTPMRGLLQFYRANILSQLDRKAEAQDAIEESIRLLPEYSGPLLVASQVETYRDRGEAAAAYLLRASRIDPQIVARIPDYDLDNLLSRIPEDTGRELRVRLIERLFETGWRGERLRLRSRLAGELIAAYGARGQLARAEAFLPQLLNPADARRLLTQTRYRALWPKIEQWSGPRQERLWPLFLNELRQRWMASRHLNDALDYASALRLANRYQLIVAEFLPLFARPRAEEDYDLQWLAPVVAGALARLGRRDEVEDLFSKALQIWPVGGDANALNLLANRGRYRYLHGDFAGAVADLRSAVADGERRGGEVSARSLLPMHHFLACALHRLGRDPEAFPSAAYVVRSGLPVTTASLHLCFDRKEAARAALIAGLAREGQRDDVIDFMQLEDEPPLPTEVDRATNARQAALRADPALLAAVAPHGRILPFAPAAGANETARPD